MPNIRVCALFRPLNAKEISDHGDTVCIRAVDSDSFLLKDDKEEEFEFHFDRVFYQRSEQAKIYEFLALPVVKGAVDGVNGAIVTYGQEQGRLTAWRYCDVHEYIFPSLDQISDRKSKGRMPNIRVCALFRPLNAKEVSDHGDTVCIRAVDSDSFLLKDDKEEEFEFHFDRVFYQRSEQAKIYEFLALPVVKGAVEGVNGAIVTYGQTGAGKTYSMEGPSIMDCDENKKGLLPRVVDDLFSAIRLSEETTKYTINLSMVEIYMERVRDLFDLSKDNLLIKETKAQGITVSGATEICISDSAEALRSLSIGIANRAVGETQMNMASSRSHCVYIFTIKQDLKKEKRSGKVILVDLAGSEKVEKTGAEGRVLEEAKNINKSLSALGNVINALTGSPQGRANHIPYRDSKLTRILQDAFVSFFS
ncbi:unnamed protein product [Fraxinus pennsylvanica]|uniref:Kinesin-like protein n=1 Tax=Fraxinus pennsylvanica TaxID=56036 RepID=A0AAD1Z939_9LAMI|nr:unnamed protein product [Fraxinus pennsylvanica]